MADEKERLLSEEELRAIEEMVASGDFDGDGYNVGAAARPHDLTIQDTSVGVNMSAMEQINDRMHRFMRSGLLDELRYSARLQPGKTKVIKYIDYVQSTEPPLSVNVTKIDPLRGESLCVIHSQVIFSCLDNWFGGSPKSLTSVAPGRVFTPTENAVIEKIRGVVFDALSEAWSPFMAIECSLNASEISAVFANIAADEDMVIQTRFETAGDGEDLGYIDVVHPYASLKLVREVFRSRVQTSSGDDQLNADWTKTLGESLDEVPMEVVVKAADVPISLDQLSKLTVGDWIPIRPPENAEVSVNGFPIYKADVGSRGNQVAVQISKSIMPRDENE